MTTIYRFVLDGNELDDADVGLGATLFNVERFALDGSPLDDEGFGLDGDDASFRVIGSGDSEAGGLVAQASGEIVITVVALADAQLGEVVAQGNATVEHSASASSLLGGVAGSGFATITVGGVAASSFGSLSVEASADIDNPATGEASLDGLVAQASGGVTHQAQAASSFQTITASGSALVVVNASGVTLIPAVDAAAIGTVIPVGEAIADAELGLLDASASASVTKKAGGTGGVRWLQQLPPQPQIVAPKDDEKEIVETVVVRDPVLVSGFASVVLGSVGGRAVGGVSWIAEWDDEELLMML